MLDLQQLLRVAGPSIILANACASGANAIGHAADMIATGAAECVLAGGFEALNELVFVGFDCLQATTVEKCRPFDLNRSGLLLGEGDQLVGMAVIAGLEGAVHCRAPRIEVAGITFQHGFVDPQRLLRLLGRRI